MSVKYSRDVKMKFSVGQILKVVGPTDGGTDIKGSKGQIFRIYHPEHNKSCYTLLITEGAETGSSFEFPESSLEEIRTQTLFAYMDKKGEVHWISKEYTEAQTKRQRLDRMKQFDKSFDLE